jgi:hypothetical protein
MESLALNDAYAASQGAEFDSLTTQDIREPIMVTLVQAFWVLSFFFVRVCIKN